MPGSRPCASLSAAGQDGQVQGTSSASVTLSGAEPVSRGGQGHVSLRSCLCLSCSPVLTPSREGPLPYCAHTRTHAHTHKRVRTYTQARTHIHTCMQTYLQYTHINRYAHTHTHAHTHILTHTHIYTNTKNHTQRHAHARPLSVCVARAETTYLDKQLSEMPACLYCMHIPDLGLLTGDA